MNRMKSLLKSKLSRLGILAAALGLSASSFGQTITTSVATGTGEQGNLPIYGLYGYTYSQQIYLASDFAPAVAGAPSIITKIRFFNVSGSLTNAQSWTVYMGNTTQADFPSTTSWVPLTGLQEVFSGNLTAPAANSWMEITLATPFLWDGVSNVVVGVDENTQSYSTINWRSHTTGANRSLRFHSDGTNPDPASPPASPSSALNRFSYVPQAQFVHVPAGACGATLSHTTAVTSDASICETDEVVFSLNNLQFATGLGFVWQYDSGAGWVDFPDSDTSVFVINDLAASSDIRAKVTCLSTNTEDISELISVAVNPIPDVTTDVANTAFCAGETVVVNADGADTYVWSPATGLDISTAETVNANPTNATTYTVTGTTTATGCKNTATVKVYPVTQVERNITSVPAEICEPDLPVALNTTVFPSAITGGGSWEYRFLGPDGTTVLQNWNTNSTYNFIPTQDSVYQYYFQVRSNQCPDNTVDPILASIPVGFGADVALTSYDCNNLGGKITLSDAFGQADFAELYSNTFTNATGLAMTGNAAITDGRLMLTPSAMSNSGTGTITIPGFVPAQNNSMNISFLLTADNPIDAGADGMAYSFGNDVLTSSGELENGKGSKLRLSFDAYDNSASNGNVAGLYLVYGWTSATSYGPASNGVLGFSPNLGLWKGKTDVPVVLSIDVNGMATVTIDGQVAFANVQLPAGYMTADISDWKHHFGARTGGFALRHAIDDFEITAGTMFFGISQENANTVPDTWQTTPVFDDLMPGTYHVWMTKNETGSCNKMIETVEIMNINPTVNLGNDTTICAGETLTLDAGNVGSSYTWGGLSAVTQTIEVSNAGTYVSYVTNADGCIGIGTIDIDVNETPSASGIYTQGLFPTVYFAVTNPQHVSAYAWNFGDGTIVSNGPSNLSHTYAEDGTYTVTATISNDCGTETLTQVVTIVNTLSIGENQIEGLTIYPNPAKDAISIQLPENMVAGAAVYSVTGAKIHEVENLQGMNKIDVQSWMKGIYFVHVTSEGKTSVTKLIIE